MVTTKTKNARCVGPTSTEDKLEFFREAFRFTPEVEDLAEFFDLLGNDTRLKIIHLLQQMGEVCVCDIAEVLEISVSAVSQQLAKLKVYGLVRARREGQTMYYGLTAHPLLDDVFHMFETLPG